MNEYNYDFPHHDTATMPTSCPIKTFRVEWMGGRNIIVVAPGLFKLWKLELPDVARAMAAADHIRRYGVVCCEESMARLAWNL